MKTRTQIIIIAATFLCVLVVGGNFTYKQYIKRQPFKSSLQITDSVINKSQINITLDRFGHLRKLSLDFDSIQAEKIIITPNAGKLNLRIEYDTAKQPTGKQIVSRRIIFDRASPEMTIFNGNIEDIQIDEIYLNSTQLWKYNNKKTEENE